MRNLLGDLSGDCQHPFDGLGGPEAYGLAYLNDMAAQDSIALQPAVESGRAFMSRDILRELSERKEPSAEYDYTI